MTSRRMPRTRASPLMQALTSDAFTSLSTRPNRQGTEVRHSQHVRSSCFSPNGARNVRHIRTLTDKQFPICRVYAATIGRGRSGVFYMSALRRWALQIRHVLLDTVLSGPSNRPEHGHRTSGIGPCWWHISLRPTSGVSTLRVCACLLYCGRLRIRRGFDRYKTLMNREESPCPRTTPRTLPGRKSTPH